MISLKDKSCIVGIGETEYSKYSGRSVTQLALEASMAAIKDAGIKPHDIDGVVPFQIGPSSEDIMAGLGNSDMSFTAVSHMGGASLVASMQLAAMSLVCGISKYVLIFTARNGRSEGRIVKRVGVIMPGQQFRTGLEYPYGWNLPAQWYSMICRRHMQEFGTTREQLAEVALTMRNHAQLNPRAQMYGKPLTMIDYLKARPIAEPYHLYDCCLETDGAVAIVMTTSDRAKDTKKVPVYLMGIGEGHAQSPDDLSNRTDFFDTGLTKAAPRAFAMGGITPEDVDGAMIYDCFTFEVIQQLEEAGFCKRGEGGAFVADGKISIHGDLPVNTHGGLLSEGHLAGLNHVVEAVRQLRKECGNRQIADAEIIAVTGWGDMGDGSMALLRR